MTHATASRQDTFVALLEQHKNIVYKVANAFGRTASDRDDLRQEIKAALWGSFARFDERLRFGTWAYRVALNVAISFSRSEKRRTDRQSIADPAELERSVRQESPNERVAMLNAFIADLADIDKALMLLHLDGYSYEEIADLVGITQTNVGTKIGRIKERARIELSRNESHERETHGN